MTRITAISSFHIPQTEDRWMEDEYTFQDSRFWLSAMPEKFKCKRVVEPNLRAWATKYLREPEFGHLTHFKDQGDLLRGKVL